MKRLVLPLFFALTACLDQSGNLNALTSFKVEVKGVFYKPDGVTRTPLAVVTKCLKQYGTQAQVPAEVRGTPACHYQIPHGEVEIDLTATALDFHGQPMQFDGPVAFKILPGDLTTDITTRWATAANGVVNATVHGLHQYGRVNVWVEDAPPAPLYNAGVLSTAGMPVEPAKRTFATGVSPVIYFDDQTLQSLQQPDGFDNRSSQFVGEFVTIGKNPESGETLNQSCSDDPSRDGQPALMVVTGLDPGGFFVSDISACRLIENPTNSTDVRTPEPPESCLVLQADGGLTAKENTDAGVGTCAISQKSCTATSQCNSYLPSTYAHMYVYNYNYPDGLNEGDLLFTLSGSVQEFTSTTQIVFPAWSIAEKVRLLPPESWDKWIKYAKPVPIGYRLCGMDNVAVPFLTDSLCGHNKRNLKMESLESGLVRINNVRFPEAFENCDFNADGQVPFYCEQTDATGWIWGSCAFGSVEPDNDKKERECTQACVIGTGKHAGQVCSEESTFKGFGQYVVELGLPGLASAGLDESDPNRAVFVAIPVPVTPDDGGVPTGNVRVDGYVAGQDVGIACDTDTHYKLGTTSVRASAADPLLAANTWTRLVFSGVDTSVAFYSAGGAGRCSVGLNSRGRINLLTADAVPQLSPDCSVTDPDETKATQCKYLRGSTFDIIGHLRHVQPARPRWMVIPRYADDVCCHPGPGLQCPTPIKPCK